MGDNRGPSDHDRDRDYLPLLRARGLQSCAAYLLVKNKFLVDLNPCGLLSGASYNPTITVHIIYYFAFFPK